MARGGGGSAPGWHIGEGEVHNGDEGGTGDSVANGRVKSRDVGDGREESGFWTSGATSYHILE